MSSTTRLARLSVFVNAAAITLILLAVWYNSVVQHSPSSIPPDEPPSGHHHGGGKHHKKRHRAWEVSHCSSLLVGEEESPLSWLGQGVIE
jgi:hypothetical protein